MVVQRNLNNAFAYDLVPSPSVIIAALKAARRVNDFPTAVRIFEGTYNHSTHILLLVAMSN
jgi:cytochrome c oxidase subunit 5a